MSIVSFFADRLDVLKCIVEFLPSLVDLANFYASCKTVSKNHLPPFVTAGSVEAKEPERININVSLPNGDSLNLNKMKVDTPFKKVFLAVGQHLKVDVHSMRFEFRGITITGDQTPAEVDMNDGDEIDCLYQKYNGKSFWQIHS